MDLSLLGEFETVVEQGGFRAAATILGLSPSALSSHIRALEADVGAQLLERTTRTVKVTAAGQALLDETRGSIAQLERTAELVRRIDRGQVERLRIGHSDSAAVELLQRSLRDLLARYDTLHLSIQQQPSAELITRLGERQLDVALLRPPLHHVDLNEEHLCDEPLVALVPDRHPLAAHTSVSLAELADSPLIVAPRNLAPATHDAIFDALRHITGTVPPTGQEAADATSFLILVAAGAGVALLPLYTTLHLRLTGIKTLTLSDHLAPLPLHVAWRRDNTNPLLISLRENLQQAARRLHPPRRNPK